MRAGRSLDEIDISVGGFTAFGETQSDVERAIAALRQPISFYGSTRTYHRVFRAHGMESLGMQLHELSLRGEWDKMIEAVNFEVAQELAHACTFDELPDFARKHFEYASRLRLDGYTRYPGTAERMAGRGRISEERLDWLVRELHNV